MTTVVQILWLDLFGVMSTVVHELGNSWCVTYSGGFSKGTWGFETNSVVPDLYGKQEKSE